MRFRTLILLLLLCGQLTAQSVSERIRSGPMLGYAEMKEVLIWLQTTQEVDVQLVYFDKEEPGRQMRTATIRTEKSRGFTAHLLADEVQPGRAYSYRILLNGEEWPSPVPLAFNTQPLWQWRGDPPEFTLATGSCVYINEPAVDRPGRPYGGDYQIFESIRSKSPDLMLWLGDNMYLREVDWNTRTGYYHRYTHSRSIPELQPLLAATHHYAIWDDHDFGPNDSDRSFIHKQHALDAFRDFWGNPGYGLQDLGGMTTAFTWGDVDFFLLDNRWFRSPNRCESCVPTILGEEQLNWLIEALTYSRASFKIVAIGGQVLNPAPVFENYANRHAAERQRLLDLIEQNNIQGVVFLSGDRHHTELSALQNGMGNWLYDLTISPLTSGGVRTNEHEGNGLRMEGTYYNDRNFATLTFSGKRNHRVMTIHLYNSDGQLIWTREIEQPGRK